MSAAFVWFVLRCFLYGAVVGVGFAAGAELYLAARRRRLLRALTRAAGPPRR